MLCSFTLLYMWPLLSEFTAGCSLDLSKPNPGLYKGSSTSCALYRSKADPYLCSCCGNPDAGEFLIFLFNFVTHN